MFKFAVLDNNNKVTNIIVAESKEIAEELTGLTCIEYNDNVVVFIGGNYDSETKTFSEPEFDPPTIEQTE
jgi:hypothetical protein